MAKYIGTYANETAIATAVNNNELSRPFVALAEDTSRVYYGSYIDLAVIGDICVYDTTTQSLRFIHQADYNTTSYPTATYEPIGVIVTDQTSTLSSVDRTVKILSKNYMDKNNPDTGNAIKQNIEWGDTTVATGATSFTDGKTNTATVLTFASGQSDWQTAATISFTDGERMYPLFECAWRYHTAGTNQGDWYIGGRTEVNELINNSTIGPSINSGLSAIGGGSYYGVGNVGSSTESSNEKAHGYDNMWSNKKRKNSSDIWGNRALCQKAVLPINA